MSDYEYTNQWVEETNVDIRLAIGVRLAAFVLALLAALFADAQWLKLLAVFFVGFAGRSAYKWINAILL